MIYIEKDDILSQIDEKVLNTLTADNDKMLDKIEMVAISEIEAYISGKYNTKEMFFGKTPKSNYLKAIIVDILLFNLFSKTTSSNVPDIRMSRYAKTIEYLQNVAKGIIILDAPIKDKDYDKGSAELRYGSFVKINNSTL